MDELTERSAQYRETRERDQIESESDPDKQECETADNCGDRGQWSHG